MTIIVEALNDARASLMVLRDDHKDAWARREGRLAFIHAVEETFEHLNRALHAATTPAALGCILAESEDGTHNPAGDG